MGYEIEWRPGAIEDITALFEYLAEICISLGCKERDRASDHCNRSPDRLPQAV